MHLKKTQKSRTLGDLRPTKIRLPLRKVQCKGPELAKTNLTNGVKVGDIIKEVVRTLRRNMKDVAWILKKQFFPDVSTYRMHEIKFNPSLF